MMGFNVLFFILLAHALTNGPFMDLFCRLNWISFVVDFQSPNLFTDVLLS